MSFPFLPGVPPLLAPYVSGAVTLLSGTIANLLGLFAQNWGIYDSNGNAVIVPDSFIGIEYINSSHISNYPVEQGSFSSYNKVANPRAWAIQIAKGGTNDSMTAFLNILETLQSSLDLYTIITPSATYLNANIERFDYRRETRHGAGMIIAILHIVEIRQAQAEYSLSGVPALAVTNPNVSMGLPNPTAVSSVTAERNVNTGQVYPSSILPSSIAGYSLPVTSGFVQ